MTQAAPARAASTPAEPAPDEARGLYYRAFLVLAMGLLPVAAWMTVAPLSPAVVAPAVVAQAYVEADVDGRAVRHAGGGIARAMPAGGAVAVAAGTDHKQRWAHAPVRLVTEARIGSADAGRVQPGQAAEIRFTADVTTPRPRTAQLVQATVTTIAAGRVAGPAGSAPYHAVLVEADAAALARAGELDLSAGMPAEVVIKGEARTPLQYLMEPVTQAWRRTR